MAVQSGAVVARTPLVLIQSKETNDELFGLKRLSLKFVAQRDGTLGPLGVPGFLRTSDCPSIVGQWRTKMPGQCQLFPSPHTHTFAADELLTNANQLFAAK